MGSKYTTNVTSGYNSSPPADDGSETEANKVKWSTIKTKLADPDKDRNDLTNTDLVEHFDQGPDAHSSAHTTIASDYNTVLEVTGTTTISLGDAATMTAGYFVTIANVGAGVVTVDLDTGADTLDGSAGGSTTVVINGALTVIVNSSADGYYSLSTGLTGVTATAAEINILDGATVTTAEVNENDRSAITVSNYLPALQGHWYNDSGATEPGQLTISASTAEGAWESWGPTSSGADNEDADLPTGIKAVVIKTRTTLSTAGAGAFNFNLYARPGDTTHVIGNQNNVASFAAVADGASEAWAVTDFFVIPVDTGDDTFDLHYTDSNCTATIVGHIWGFYI